jgi:hypothetical protein
VKADFAGVLPSLKQGNVQNSRKNYCKEFFLIKTSIKEEICRKIDI